VTTYYDGYDIQWLENGTFKIGKKNFKTLRDAMDYVDEKRHARVNNNLGTSGSELHSAHVDG
jgi:hypothetical protein